MKKSNLGFLLVLLVFAVFMVSILVVLLTGADVVQGITERDQKNYEQRTAVQYIASRVRQADQAGMIRVDSSDSTGDRLILSEELDGILCETVIYCYDGYLWELFSVNGYDPGAEFGEKILPVERFFTTDCGSYLEIEVWFADGETRSIRLYLRSERGAVS